MPNFGAGVYYHTDKFYAGLSFPRIVNNKLFKKDDKTDFTGARQSRHIFIMSGVVIPLSIDLKLKPSTLIKIVAGSPVQMDLNANLWLFDIASLGLSYRIAAHTLVSMLEVQATRQIRFGYSYDAGFGKITTIGSGAHEIMLRYEFGYVKNKMTSPRYF